MTGTTLNKEEEFRKDVIGYLGEIEQRLIRIEKLLNSTKNPTDIVAEYHTNTELKKEIQ